MSQFSMYGLLAAGLALLSTPTWADDPYFPYSCPQGVTCEYTLKITELGRPSVGTRRTTYKGEETIGDVTYCKVVNSGRVPGHNLGTYTYYIRYSNDGIWLRPGKRSKDVLSKPFPTRLNYPFDVDRLSSKCSCVYSEEDLSLPEHSYAGALKQACQCRSLEFGRKFPRVEYFAPNPVTGSRELVYGEYESLEGRAVIVERLRSCR